MLPELAERRAPQLHVLPSVDELLTGLGDRTLAGAQTRNRLGTTMALSRRCCEALA